jgi:probable rRNA maturation factor
MKLNLTVQYVYDNNSLPKYTDFELWTKTVLKYQNNINNKTIEVNIRIVDEIESAELNQTWRNKQGATNVLSFPLDFDENHLKILGDIIICAPIVIQEAQKQNKQLKAHWSHLVIHGLLHLLGHDHIENLAAEMMENLEIKFLQQLKYPNPYL